MGELYCRPSHISKINNCKNDLFPSFFYMYCAKNTEKLQMAGPEAKRLELSL
jgi:hypothetical protein